MFTGIVEEVGKVISLEPERISISAGVVLEGTVPGSSIAVNGVCLTAVSLTRSSFIADVMPETLNRTNLGKLKTGDVVNLERPMTLGGRLGGHLVQGHIDNKGVISSIKPEGQALLIKIEAPTDIMYYIVEKGFVAVDGMSLTVAERTGSSFTVSIVNYTQQNTNLVSRKTGDMVNLEIDIIAKYVERLTRTAKPHGITREFLEENGFPVN